MEHLLPGQLQLLAQEGDKLVPFVPLDLQPHRGQAGALLDDFAHVLPEVLVDLIGLVLGADVGVPGDRHHRPGGDGELVKELVGVVGQDVLQQHVPQAPLLQQQEGGQARGDGD